MTPPIDQRGFTLIELLISVVLSSVLLIAVGRVILTGSNLSDQTSTTIDVEEQLWLALTRISEDLRSAGKLGEDTNDDDTEDTGEDSNGNSRFEDDWLVTANSVKFNPKVSREFSLPVTYRLSGDILERVVMVDTAGAETVTVMAKNVTTFTVVDGAEVVVTLGVTIQTAGGTPMSGTQSISVKPRN